jgi:hypothetical protein
MAVTPCLTVLERLHEAIVALAGGAAVTQVSFGDRTVSYSAAKLAELQSVYRMYYRICGAGSGLPDLAATVERGPPARSVY